MLLDISGDVHDDGELLEFIESSLDELYST